MGNSMFAGIGHGAVLLGGSRMTRREREQPCGLSTGYWLLNACCQPRSQIRCEGDVSQRVLALKANCNIDKGFDTYQRAFTDGCSWVQAENERLADYEVVYFAGRSFDDEFGDSISNDVILLQVAIAAIGIYTMIQLSRCRDNFVGARITLTLLGVRPLIVLVLVHVCVLD